MKIVSALTFDMYSDRAVPIATKINLAAVKNLLQGQVCESYIAYRHLCNVISNLLDVEITPNPVKPFFDANVTVLIVNYYGQTCPPWATELPDNSTLSWYKVDFVSKDDICLDKKICTEIKLLAKSAAKQTLQKNELVSFLRFYYPQYWDEDPEIQALFPSKYPKVSNRGVKNGK